jgi:hypothetical protein
MSQARPFAFSLLAGLFALVSSGVLTGQSLTRAPFPTVPMAAYPGDLAVSRSSSPSAAKEGRRRKNALTKSWFD